MEFEMQCPECGTVVNVSTVRDGEDNLKTLPDIGPWDALGDGETFEDRLYTLLDSRGELECPICKQKLCVTEERLGHWTKQMLAAW